MLNFIKNLFCIRLSYPISEVSWLIFSFPLVSYCLLAINLIPSHGVYLNYMVNVGTVFFIASVLLLSLYKYHAAYGMQVRLAYALFQLTFIAFLPHLFNYGFLYGFLAIALAIFIHFHIPYKPQYNVNKTLENIQHYMKKNNKPELDLLMPAELFVDMKEFEMSTLQVNIILIYGVVGLITSGSLFFLAKMFRAFNRELILTSLDPRFFYLAIMFNFFIYPLIVYFSIGSISRGPGSLTLIYQAGRHWRASKNQVIH